MQCFVCQPHQFAPLFSSTCPTPGTTCHSTVSILHLSIRNKSIFPLILCPMIHEIPMLNLVYELLFQDATFAISSEKSLNIVNLPHLPLSVLCICVCVRLYACVFMCACACACMCVTDCACGCACMRVCACAQAGASAWVCACICARVCVGVGVVTRFRRHTDI